MIVANFDLHIDTDDNTTTIEVTYPVNANYIISDTRFVKDRTVRYEYYPAGLSDKPTYDDDRYWAWDKDILNDSISNAKNIPFACDHISDDALAFFDWFHALTEEQHRLIDAAQIINALKYTRIPTLYKNLPDDLKASVKDAMND